MNEKDIAEALTKFDDKNHPKGETLSTSTRVFRVRKGGPCIFEEWNAIESTRILQGVV